jgi:ABC-type lipoprotein release transport system permease subunit
MKKLLTPLFGALALLAICAAFWKGVEGLVVFLESVAALVVIVCLLASLASIGIAFIPLAKVPFRYNLRNLQARWKTSLATGVAFTLVVGLLTVMLAFVKGMERLTEGTGQPGNVVILSEGAIDEAFSTLPATLSVHHLPNDVQNMIRRDPDVDGKSGKLWAVREMYLVANQDLAPSDMTEERERLLQMRGVDDPIVAAKVHGVELDKGEWFSPTGVNEKTGEYEIVLGHGLAKFFGQDKSGGPVGPGETISIGPTNWRVAGVMKASSSVFGSEVWARDVLVARDFGNVKDGAITYNSMVVRLSDPALAAEAAEQIKKARSEQRFEAIPETEYYAKQTQTGEQLLNAITVVAVVMAFGGILGLVNTMFAAISQRSKDIGVLRLLGFSRWQVLRSFLLESVVIAFLGGLLGCGLGLLADGWTATSLVSAQGSERTVVLKLVVDGRTLAASMLFTLVTASVGGMIPALVAMRLGPLQSLR